MKIMHFSKLLKLYFHYIKVHFPESSLIHRFFSESFVRYFFLFLQNKHYSSFILSEYAAYELTQKMLAVKCEFLLSFVWILVQLPIAICTIFNHRQIRRKFIFGNGGTNIHGTVRTLQKSSFESRYFLIST